MKPTLLGVILLCAAYCSAVEGTNVIAMSDWSASVNSADIAVRARLLILSGNPPNYGRPESGRGSMLFLELENVTMTHRAAAKVFFDLESIHFDFVGTNGLSVPFPKRSGGYRGGTLNQTHQTWLLLPWNSPVSLFVAAGGSDAIMFYRNGGDPGPKESFLHPWHIPLNDSNDHYLAATLKFDSPTNGTRLVMTPAEKWIGDGCQDWRGVLKIPPMRIAAKQK